MVHMCDVDFVLFVPVPPNIAGTGGPQELAVLQNSQVILECRSDAVPPPTISWLKDGELLEVPRLQPSCWPFAPCTCHSSARGLLLRSLSLSPSYVPGTQSSWVAPVPLQSAPTEPPEPAGM